MYSDDLISNHGLCTFLSVKCETLELHLPLMFFFGLDISCDDLDMMFENVLIEKDHSASAIVEL